MKSFSTYLRFITVACVAALIGIAATAAFGQERSARDTARVEIKGERGFCNNNNWSSDDRVSVNELREMTLASTGSLTVDGGQNGGIGVKGEDRSDILVRACVQAWGTTEAAAKAAAAGIKISTGSLIKAESAGDDKNFSVSYQLIVPRSTNLNLTAHNGGISINGVEGTAEFDTQNGGVSLNNVAGTVKGRTTNGGVNVVLAGNSWKGGGLDVQTTNGGVNITMPETYAAHVDTGTVNGGFSSDIPSLSFDRASENGRQRAVKISTDLNGGGAPIRIITTNGGVRINSNKGDK